MGVGRKVYGYVGRGEIEGMVVKYSSLCRAGIRRWGMYHRTLSKRYQSSSTPGQKRCHEKRRKEERKKEERPTSGILKLRSARANPVIQSISQKAHLHPLATTAKPATIGPKVGPAAHARSYKPIE
jgi:hypothetical protein